MPWFAIALLLAQTPNTAKIKGIITDALTHRPIPNVHVSTTVGKHFTGSLTAFDGSYTLENLPDGPARMTVNLDGYRLIIADQDKDAAFPLAAGETTTHNFEMHPLGRIYGKLTDRDTGSPIDGHPVYAMRRGHLPGHSSYGGRSDDPRNGAFDLRNLEPGDYIIEVNSENEPRLSPEPSRAPAKKYYGERWYPDVARRDMASVIHLGEGETRNIDIAIESLETHTLSGTVEVPHELDHQPVVFAFRTSGGGRGRTLEMPEPGPFRIENLAPGTYRLAFTAGKSLGSELGFVVATPRAAEAAGDFEIEIADHDIENYRAILMPGAGVAGEIRMLEEDAALPAMFGLELVPTADWIAHLKNGGTMVSGTMPIETARIESGRFHREPIRPGDYWPLLALPPGYAVTQVRFQNSMSPYTAMHLTAPNTPVTVTVTSHPGAIAGIVVGKDDAPLPGATVVLVPYPMPDNPGPTAIRSEESGPNGAFVFPDLAPGAYKALAFTVADAAYEGDVSYLREHSAKADVLEVRAGQSVSVTLK